MKYIICPIFRLTFVLICLLVMPVVYASAFLASVWVLDWEPLRAVTKWYFPITKPVVDRDTFSYPSLEYRWPNVIDFILDRNKTTRKIP